MNLTERRERAAAKKASLARLSQANAEAQQALTANKCPCCGAGVHQNLALTGWVQCDRYGSEGFGTVLIRQQNDAPAATWAPVRSRHGDPTGEGDLG